MRLLIFTQKVDKNDPVLGFFHTWVEEFAKHCESIKVICLYKGKFDLPANVEVFSLGKELGFSRFSYLKNLYKYLYKLNGSYDKVFVHMNPIYLVLCGLYFRLKRIPTYLWYVHRSVNLKLRIATLFADKVFTSAKESFKIDSNKVVYLGHGIDINSLPNTSHLYTGNTLRIAHIGRITLIKNIEVLIDAGLKLKERDLNIQIILYGDCVTKSDEQYKKSLKKIIDKKGLKNNVTFAGSVLHKDLPATLSDCHISVNMTPLGGMDKAVLEAILLGIPTFVSNTVFTALLGEYADMFMYTHKDSTELAEKIYNFTLTAHNQFILDNLNSKVRKDFSLEHLVEKIIKEMN